MDSLKSIFCLCCIFLSLSTYASNLTKVKLFLKWDHQFQFAGYYAAIEKGFFATRGIDVQLVSRIDEAGNILDLYGPINAGEVDFSTGGPDILLEIDKGSKLLVVATFFQKSPFGYFSLKENNINGPSDLHGKRIMSSTGDFSDFEILSMMHNEGVITPNFTKSPWAFDAEPIYNGEADIKATYILSALWETRDKKEQLKYFSSADYGLNFYGDLLLTTKKLVNSNPKLVEDFRNASIEGWKYALLHPEEISKLIVAKYPAKIETYSDNYAFNMFSFKVINDLMSYPYVDVGNSSNDRWHRIHEYLTSINVLNKEYDEDNTIFSYQRILSLRDKKNVKSLQVFILFLAIISLIFLIMYRVLKKERSIESKLNLFFDNSPIGFSFCKMDGVFIEVNNEFLRITGYDLEELKRLSYWDLTPQKYEKEEKNQIESLNKRGRYGPYRKEYLNKQREVVPVELNGFIVEDYNGVKGIWSSVEDISEKMITEKNLEQQIILNEHSSKLASIGEIAAGVGHEINNPLAISIGNVSLVRKELSNDNYKREKVFKRLDKIEQGHERIRKIVDGLRTYARSDTDHNEIVSMREAIDQTVNLISEIYEKDGILIIRSNLEVELYTKGSLGKVQQIIMNLISNAKDATEGSEERSIKLSLGKYNDKSLVFSVSDTGCGISDDIKDKILNPFFTTKEVGKGTGIGLGVVAEIVKSMSGQLEIKSKIGEGSTFSIILPIEDGTVLEQQQQQQQGMSLKGTVLIVDDEEDLREILRDYLENIGLVVEEADDGDTALEMVKFKKYDYICTDMKMPRMNGEVFIKEARKLPNGNTKYVIITGGVITDDSSSKELYLRKLSDEFVLKPFSKEDIFDALVKVRRDA